jgi:hypothetical protein
MGITRSIWYNKLVRRIYNGLPLPWHVKQRLKEIYLRRPGAWKANNKDLFRLTGNREALVQIVAGAREFNPAQPWVLIIDSEVPLTEENSSHVRMSALFRLLREMSFRATFVSDSGTCPHLDQQLLEQENVTVVNGFDAARHHLAEAGGKYHFVLMLRPEVAFKYLPHVRAHALYSKVIYDTTGLRWVVPDREIQTPANHDNYRNHDLSGDASPDRLIEVFNAACADLIVTGTDEEKNHLLGVEPNIEVAVLPPVHEIFPPRIPFAQPRADV